MDSTVPPNRNSRFPQWKLSFPLMGTTVSLRGNARFSSWERQSPYNLLLK